MNTIKPLVAKNAGEAKAYVKYVKKMIALQIEYERMGMKNPGVEKWASSFTGSNALSPYLKNGQALFTNDEAHNELVINDLVLMKMGYPIQVISFESSKTENPVYIQNPVFELIDLLDIAEKEKPSNDEKINSIETQLEYYNKNENKTIRNSTSTNSRRSGVDITHSASKDFSIIDALCIDKNDMTLSNHMNRIYYESSQISLNHILSAAKGRKKENGIEVLYDCVASAMSVLHGEARAVKGYFADMMKHGHHDLIPSVIIVRNGKEEMTTLDLNSCEKVIHEADLLARIHRATELQKLGVELERIGNGDVKIKAVSDEYIEHFSKRSNDAEDLMNDKPGLTKDHAILNGKHHKDLEITRDELEADWNRQSAELELQSGDLRLNAESIAKNVFFQLKGDDIAKHQRALFKAQEVLLTKEGAEKAMVGVDGCFTAQKLKEHYLLSIIGTGKTPEFAYNLFNEHIATLEKEHLHFNKIELTGKTEKYYTCRYALNLVNDISRLSKKSNQTVFDHQLTDRMIMSAMSKFEEQTGRQMTTCQVNASYSILQSKSQFIWCEGAAGSGKSFTSKLTADLYESLKTADGKPMYDMIYLASTHKAKKVLNKDLGKKEGEVYTLSQLVVDLKNEKRELKANSILMIDEAVMCGVEDIAYILKAADKVGSRIIFGGDLNQLESVSFTNPISLLARELNNESKFRLDTVVRQQTSGLLRLANALKNNEKTKEELVAIFEEAQDKGWLNGCEDDLEAQQQLIERFIDSPIPLENKLILTPRNDDVERFNSAIQFRLKESKIAKVSQNLALGLISESDAKHSIDTLNKSVEFYTYAKDTKKRPHKYEISLNEGDPIVILKTEKLKEMNVGSRGIENGDNGKIQNIHGNKFEILFDSGKILKCDTTIKAGKPGSVPDSLRLAYAGTSHSGQGATVDLGLAFFRKSESQLNKNNIYVMLSRMRNEIGIYCEKSMIERLHSITAQVRKSDMWEMVANVDCWKEAVKTQDIPRSRMILAYNRDLNDLVRSDDYLNDAKNNPQFASFLNKVLNNESTTKIQDGVKNSSIGKITDMEQISSGMKIGGMERVVNMDRVIPKIILQVEKVKMIYRKFESIIFKAKDMIVSRETIKEPVVNTLYIDKQESIIAHNQNEAVRLEVENTAAKLKVIEDQKSRVLTNAKFTAYKELSNPELVEKQKLASVENAAKLAARDHQEEVAMLERLARIKAEEAVKPRIPEFNTSKIDAAWAAEQVKVEVKAPSITKIDTIDQAKIDKLVADKEAKIKADNEAQAKIRAQAQATAKEEADRKVAEKVEKDRQDEIKAQAKIQSDKELMERIEVKQENDEVKQELELGNNPLHTALKKGDIDLATRLISEDGDLQDAINIAGDKPFWIADVKAKGNNGNTALHLAAGIGDKDDILSLTRRGSNVNAVNLKGEMPKAIAAFSNNADAVKTFKDLSYVVS